MLSKLAGILAGVLMPAGILTRTPIDEAAPNYDRNTDWNSGTKGNRDL